MGKPEVVVQQLKSGNLDLRLQAVMTILSGDFRKYAPDQPDPCKK